MTDQSPEANLGDSRATALLRARVERMMQVGRIRNAEGERVAALTEEAAEAVVETLLRHALSTEATLVLHQDNTVTWETP